MNRNAFLLSQKNYGYSHHQTPILEKKVKVLSPTKNYTNFKQKKFFQNLPPIILPLVQTEQNGNSINSSLPQRNVNYTNNDVPYLPKLHPLTPHVHAQQDILPLISRCSHNEAIKYKIIQHQKHPFI